MMNNSTIEALKAMRFSAMAAEFERQLGDPAAYSMLGFEERFALMVDAEWNRRQQNKLARCIREAHFAAPGAMIEDIEYHEDRRLDKTQILRFATCKYIEDGHHIILKGASGSGKTFLACALGNAACRKYKSVRYIRLPELLEELSLAQASGELKKLIKSYRKYDLLILDEWLIRCLTPQESYNLLEIVEMRSDRGATIFCTQYNTDEWYERINPDSDDRSPISEAIMDRIVHNAYLRPLKFSCAHILSLIMIKKKYRRNLTKKHFFCAYLLAYWHF